MRKNSQKFRSVLEKVRFYILAALFFSIPIHPKMTTILIMAYAVVSLFGFGKEYFQDFLRRRNLLLYIFMYLVLVLGLTYTVDLQTGLSKIQTQLSFIVFPLFMGGRRILKKERDIYLNSFVLGLLVTIMLCFANVLYRIFSDDSIYVMDEFSRKHYIFYYTEFSAFLGLHPTYFSIYLGFSLFYLASVFYQNTKFSRLLKGFLIVLFFIGMFLTSSKAGILSFIILAVGYLVYKFIKQGKKINFLIFSILVIGTVIMFATNPLLYERSLQAFNSIENVYNSNEQLNESTSKRFSTWRLSIKTSEDALLFRHGTGSVNKILNDNCIELFSFSTCEGLRNNNSHNQYLNFLVSNGLLLLLPFLLVLVIGVREALKNEDIAFFFFISFLTLNFFFESILERERGVVFFMLFIVLFTITRKEDHPGINGEAI